jgi:uncharacterized protein (DUF1330 family)
MTGVEYPTLMVGELAIHDWRAFSRYGREAVPLVERFGGRVLAMRGASESSLVLFDNVLK